MTVTDKEIKAASITAGVGHVDHHTCSMCGYMTKYVIHGDQLFFDPGCHCTGGYRLEPREWSHAANWINMQSNDSVRQSLRAAFGLKAEGPDNVEEPAR